MSLKVFHVVFITLSIVLALGSGIWAIGTYLVTGDPAYLGGVLLSFAGAVLLAVYETRVIRKFKAMGTGNVLYSAN